MPESYPPRRGGVNERTRGSRRLDGGEARRLRSPAFDRSAAERITGGTGETARSSPVPSPPRERPERRTRQGRGGRGGRTMGTFTVGGRAIVPGRATPAPAAGVTRSAEPSELTVSVPV